MNVLIGILAICFFIGFIITFPYIGLPIVAMLVIVCIVKRKKVKNWYDNLPVYEKPKKENPPTQAAVGSQKIYHTDSNKLPPTEKEANSFAIRLLSPACVLWGLDIHAAADISRACELPDDMAQARAVRMGELYKRQKFLTSPLERQVFEQFKDYIEKNRPQT